MDTLKGMSVLESRHRNELGPHFGFDILKIRNHYNHRREIRQNYLVFQLGKTVYFPSIPLGEKEEVFGFARIYNKEFSMVFINFTENFVSCSFDRSSLYKYITDIQSIFRIIHRG